MPGLVPKGLLDTVQRLPVTPGKEMKSSNTEPDRKRERLERVGVKDALHRFFVPSHALQEGGYQVSA